MRVLVTGGAGFIGANLVRELLQDPTNEVRVVDDLSTGHVENIADLPVDFRQASILDGSAVAEAADGCDAIVHLGAVPSVPRSVADPLRSHHANTTGTLNILEAARPSKAHVILASSSSVYGGNPAMPKSEDLVPMPLSPYAASKLALEAYARAYANCYDVPVLTLRFFNVFGPFQRAGHAYAAVIPAFIDAALNGQPLPVHGDGSQTRDFTYVGSVTGLIARAIAGRVVSPDPVNLAFGTSTSLLALIDCLENILGRPLELGHGEVRSGDVKASQADPGRLYKLFPGIKPVPLTEALEKTVHWWTHEYAVAQR